MLKSDSTRVMIRVRFCGCKWPPMIRSTYCMTLKADMDDVVYAAYPAYPVDPVDPQTIPPKQPNVKRDQSGSVQCGAYS